VAPGVPAEVVSRRPDLRAAERSYLSAFYRVEEARASLYPRISLTSSGGFASSDLSDLLSGDFGVWSLAANLAGPLFQGGRLRENITLKEAQQAEAEAAFASAVLRAFTEVETSLAAEGFLRDREAALTEYVDRAGASASLSERRFLTGLTDITTVLEARRRHYSAEGQLVRVRLERLQNRVDFYASLGGGAPAGPVAEDGVQSW
jgi:outer membrane protein, multidrug efflux system